MSSLDKYAEIFSNFGLTFNQAKVYLATVIFGLASVSQVAKASKVRREEVYRMLPRLEKLALIERMIDNPIKIRATPVNEAISLLIKREQDRAKKREVSLIANKDEFLKMFKVDKYKHNPEITAVHFSMISGEEAVLSKGLTMLNATERTIDAITSKYVFNIFFRRYRETLAEAIRKGVTVRMVLDIPKPDDLILSVVEEYKTSKAPISLKYSTKPVSHYTIMDYKQALVATSTEPTAIELANYYLWTDDSNLVNILQKHFEDVWHTSTNIN